MTQEEKQLLLKDLCERLPYGVKILDNTFKKYGASELINIGIDGSMLVDNKTNDIQYYPIIDNIKPYLRPMSSMTAEEEYEYHQCKNIDYLEICEMEHAEMLKTTALCFSRATDWLNKNMFDYRGLIPMGLALEAPEGMYETK